MALVVHDLHVGILGSNLNLASLAVTETDLDPFLTNVTRLRFEQPSGSVAAGGPGEAVITVGTVRNFSGENPLSFAGGVTGLIFTNCEVTEEFDIATVNAASQKAGLSFPTLATRVAVWNSDGQLGVGDGPSGIEVDDNDDVFFNGIGAVKLPNLTTAERDAHGTGSPGQIIYNETLKRLEFNDESSTHYWQGLAVAADNVVEVNALEDFPAPSGSVITLDAKFYLINGVISLGSNSFAWGDCLGIIGRDKTNAGIVGSAAAFVIVATGADASVYVRGVSFTNFSSLGVIKTTYTETLRDVFIDKCSTLGHAEVCNLSGVAAFHFLDTDCLVHSAGIVSIVSDIETVDIRGCALKFFGGYAIDFATFEATDVFIHRNTGYLAAGDIFLGGQADGSNVVSPNRAIVSDNAVRGADTANEIVPATAIGWHFHGNLAVLDDTRDNPPSGALYVLTNAIETAIAVQGTFVIFGLGHAAGDLIKFTQGAQGLLTYDEAETVKVAIDAQARLETVAAGAQTLSVEIIKNGTRIPGTLASKLFQVAGEPDTISIQWEVVIDSGDTLQMRVANESGTGNVVADQVTFRVRTL